jgi:hypothetical protein
MAVFLACRQYLKKVGVLVPVDLDNTLMLMPDAVAGPGDLLACRTRTLQRAPGVPDQ